MTPRRNRSRALVAAMFLALSSTRAHALVTGSLLVTDDGAKAVFEVRPAGAILKVAKDTRLQHPFDAIVDVDGSLIVADRGADTGATATDGAIYRVSPATGLITATLA